LTNFSFASAHPCSSARALSSEFELKITLRVNNVTA